MLWVYGHYNLFNSLSAGTSDIYVRFWHLKKVPVLKKLTFYIPKEFIFRIMHYNNKNHNIEQYLKIIMDYHLDYLFCKQVRETKRFLILIINQ